MRHRCTDPDGRIGRPEDLVGAVLFPACDESSFVTRSTMIVNAPYLVWRLAIEISKWSCRCLHSNCGNCPSPRPSPRTRGGGIEISRKLGHPREPIISDAEYNCPSRALC
jgi:hypothetical protein